MMCDKEIFQLEIYIKVRCDLKDKEIICENFQFIEE